MLSKVDFINKAENVHGKKYIYDYVIINRLIDKVEIKCPVHGIFYQSPKSHLNGSGCPKCAIINRTKKRTSTSNEFIKKANNVHNYKYSYSKVEYLNNRTKVCIICPEHGEFWQTPGNHLLGQGCPECYGNRLKTTKEYVNEAKIIHNNTYDYSKLVYKGNKSNVCIICREKDNDGIEHGEFWQQALTHLRGYGCPKCSLNYKMTNEEFINKANAIHNNVYDYSKTNFISSHKKVCIVCHKKDILGKEHGEFWQVAKNHLKGEKCPKCQGKKIDQEEIIYRFNLIHNNRYDYSHFIYKNTRSKSCIICPEHGEFYQTPQMHLQGCGCPKCKQSQLEKEIMKCLDENKIRYVYQAGKSTLSWIDKQYIDFYLPDYKTAIECQGIQHFKPCNFGSRTVSETDCFKLVQERDKKKRILCHKNNIRLLYYTSKEIYNKISTNLKCMVNKQELLNAIKHISDAQ